MKFVREFLVSKSNPYLIDTEGCATDLGTFKRSAIVVPVFIGLVVNTIVEVFIVLPILFIFILIFSILKACLNSFQMVVNDLICIFSELFTDTKATLRVIKGTHGIK